MNHPEIRTLDFLSIFDGDSWSLDECIDRLQALKKKLACDEEATVEITNNRYDGPSIAVYATRQLTAEEIAALHVLREKNEREYAVDCERRQRQQYETLKAIYESTP